MRFRIGPWVYRVEISQGALMHEGREVAGLCVPSEHRIIISGSLHPRQRLGTLLHELRHAWTAEMGKPLGDEDDANQSASMMASTMRELIRQGGEASLMQLASNGVVDHSLHIAAERVGAECIGCGGRFSPAQIRTEPAVFEPLGGRLVVHRSLYCDFCGHVQAWSEVATSGGLPSGTPVGAPSLLKGEVVEKWLNEHHGAMAELS